jgi:endonuclease/exonuclease/phosphatase family metal-dependent hydrolase
MKARFVNLLAAVTFVMAPAVAFAQTAPPLRVMSFNIRYGTANDGENHWDKRKEFLVETIKEFGPDLLGTQETLGFQRDYLAQHLPDYGVLGVGRDDGKEQGEMMALYFRKSRFERLDAGHFWLSETPDQPGSKSWDTSLPRMVTWVKLKDRKQPSAPPLLFLNTHFDHRGPAARLESGRLVRRKIGELAAGASVIVTGDFNSGEGSQPYHALFATIEDSQSPVIDAYRAVHPARAANEGTATGFDVSKTTGPRIDWIACSRDWKVLEARINRIQRHGRPPSDHFPVEAVVQR